MNTASICRYHDTSSVLVVLETLVTNYFTSILPSQSLLSNFSYQTGWKTPLPLFGKEVKFLKLNRCFWELLIWLDRWQGSPARFSRGFPRIFFSIKQLDQICSYIMISHFTSLVSTSSYSPIRVKCLAPTHWSRLEIKIEWMHSRVCNGCHRCLHGDRRACCQENERCYHQITMVNEGVFSSPRYSFNHCRLSKIPTLGFFVLLNWSTFP